MKGQDLLILAGGGYIIYQLTGGFKGIGAGVGTAVEKTGEQIGAVVQDTGEIYNEFAGVFENSFGILNDSLKGLRDQLAGNKIDFDYAQQSVYDAYDLGFYEGAVDQSDQNTRTILNLRQQITNAQNKLYGNQYMIDNDLMKQRRGEELTSLKNQLLGNKISLDQYNKSSKSVPAKVFINFLEEKSGSNLMSKIPKSSNNNKVVNIANNFQSKIKNNTQETKIKVDLSSPQKMSTTLKPNKITSFFK